MAFSREEGIYVPAEDGIKFTAVVGNAAREFIVTRAALIAAGANPTMDPASLLEFFEGNREQFEAAALNVLPTSAGSCRVGAAEIARARLAPLVGTVGWKRPA